MASSSTRPGAATFGGFTQSGDVTVNTSTGVATIQPNAVTTSKILNGNVTNTKLAPGAANTLKGSLDGITTSDLAIASCSALYNLLSGCQALAGSAASIRCCHHARSPRRSIRRRSPRSPRSAIRMCDTFTSTSHFFALCDVNWHTACFGTVLRNLQLAARTSVASSSAYMVYSNNTQDSGGIDNVYIYAGTRGCVHFEKGYGGASRASIDKLSCTALSTLPMVWMGNTTGSGVNFGSTILALRDIVLGGPSSGGTYQTGPGFLLNGGFPRIENSRCENMAVCIEINTPSGTGNGDLITITNANNASTGAPAPACTSVVQIDNGNNPLNALMSQIPIGGCTNTISNLQGGTNNTTVNVLKALTCPNAGVCS
ncbi:hypothetical protein [Bradyrhizobium sp. LM6.9]